MILNISFELRKLIRDFFADHTTLKPSSLRPEDPEGWCKWGIACDLGSVHSRSRDTDLTADNSTCQHVNALAHHRLLLVPRLRRSSHPSCHSRPSPYKSPFASPRATTDIATHRLLRRPTPQKRATLINVSQVPCTSSLTSRPSALARVCVLVDLHIASFGLICSPFRTFLYLSFVLDLSPCLVSLLLDALTIGH